MKTMKTINRQWLKNKDMGLRYYDWWDETYGDKDVPVDKVIKALLYTTCGRIYKAENMLPVITICCQLLPFQVLDEVCDEVKKELGGVWSLVYDSRRSDAKTDSDRIEAYFAFLLHYAFNTYRSQEECLKSGSPKKVIELLLKKAIKKGI